MVKREIREQARDLRRQGMSVGDIARTLSVSRGSVSVWVRDIELTEAQKEHLKQNKIHWGAQNKGAKTNQRRALEKRELYQEAGRNRAREGRPLHLAGCMLYWAEGAKRKNNLYFVNSDVNMLRLYIRFLREELGVQDTEISLYIHCHNAAHIERIQHYWLDVLVLPKSSLRQAYVKKGSDTRRNILINGVCGIAVYKTELVQHVYGAIQEYAGFDCPEWLF